MKTTLLSILSLIFAASVLRAQEPAKPAAKSDAAAEIKVASAPYHAAVEAVSAEYQKWVTSLETWYLAELDKLQAARAKLGDLDGAIATKKERERMASHSPTTPEQIQAMPAPLRTLRAGYDQGLKNSADEGARRMDVARRKYLADLEALQKRITVAGDIDQALLVKAEKDRFIAEMATGSSPVPQPSTIPAPVTPVPVIAPEPTPKVGTIRSGSNAATPAAATKDKPFVNTLGQEFVPVPGTQVLFCRWQTRAKDYTRYAKANAKTVDSAWTTREFSGIPVGREPEHPVCGVNWADANAFCEWLTKKETAEGKLPKGMKYRLPTDEEWSIAVGLPPEAGETPKEKNGKDQVDFPWGTDWPPKEKVANYADETYHAKAQHRDDKQKPWIEGYTDGFVTTSPVGSFPANRFGLYDMGGNVWQWCEDLFEPGGTDRVMRGGSWNDYIRDGLLSSHRGRGTPDARYFYHGFRCVLGASAR